MAWPGTVRAKGPVPVDQVDPAGQEPVPRVPVDAGEPESAGPHRCVTLASPRAVQGRCAMRSTMQDCVDCARDRGPCFGSSSGDREVLVTRVTPAESLGRPTARWVSVRHGWQMLCAWGSASVEMSVSRRYGSGQPRSMSGLLRGGAEIDGRGAASRCTRGCRRNSRRGSPIMPRIG